MTRRLPAIVPRALLEAATLLVLSARNRPAPLGSAAAPTRQRRVLLINQYFPPDIASTGHLAAELAQALSERGAGVTVITGQPSYTSDAMDAPSQESVRGVRVIRVPMPRSRGRARQRTRLIGYLRFLTGALFATIRETRRCPPDTIVAFHNPPLVGVIGALVRARAHRFVLIPMDIHPDILVESGAVALPKAVWTVWERLNRWTYRCADCIVVFGEDMRTTMLRKGVHPDQVVSVLPWARPELSKFGDGGARTTFRRRLGYAERDLLVLYAGNFGVMHPMSATVAAARELKGEAVQFLLIGDGVRRAGVEHAIAKHDLRNVRLLPYQSELDFAAAVVAADVCLVLLEAGMERFSFPSRAITFLSARRPLLALVPQRCHLGRLLREGHAGWVAEDPQELTRLLSWLSKHPRAVARATNAAGRLYESRLDRESLLGRFADVVLPQRPNSVRAR